MQRRALIFYSFTDSTKQILERPHHIRNMDSQSTSTIRVVPLTSAPVIETMHTEQIISSLAPTSHRLHTPSDFTLQATSHSKRLHTPSDFTLQATSHSKRLHTTSDFTLQATSHSKRLHSPSDFTLQATSNSR